MTVCVFLLMAFAARRPSDFRLLYWNIQNGMWDGQPDHYDRFVAWVRAQRPDVCVFCEAATIYKDGTDDYMPEDEHYLPDGANWPAVTGISTSSSGDGETTIRR